MITAWAGRLTPQAKVAVEQRIRILPSRKSFSTTFRSFRSKPFNAFRNTGVVNSNALSQHISQVFAFDGVQVLIDVVKGLEIMLLIVMFCVFNDELGSSQGVFSGVHEDHDLLVLHDELLHLVVGHFVEGVLLPLLVAV